MEYTNALAEYDITANEIEYRFVIDPIVAHRVLNYYNSILTGSETRQTVRIYNDASSKNDIRVYEHEQKCQTKQRLFKTKVSDNCTLVWSDEKTIRLDNLSESLTNYKLKLVRRYKRVSFVYYDLCQVDISYCRESSQDFKDTEVYPTSLENYINESGIAKSDVDNVFVCEKYELEIEIIQKTLTANKTSTIEKLKTFFSSLDNLLYTKIVPPIYNFPEFNMPSDLMRYNLLDKYEYKSVTYKLDGTRCMLLVHKQMLFYYTRSGKYEYVDRIDVPESEQYLFDAELFDNVSNEKTSLIGSLSFYIFDYLSCNDKISVRQRNLRKLSIFNTSKLLTLKDAYDFTTREDLTAALRKTIAVFATLKCDGFIFNLDKKAFKFKAFRTIDFSFFTIPKASLYLKDYFHKDPYSLRMKKIPTDTDKLFPKMEYVSNNLMLAKLNDTVLECQVVLNNDDAVQIYYVKRRLDKKSDQMNSYKIYSSTISALRESSRLGEVLLCCGPQMLMSYHNNCKRDIINSTQRQTDDVLDIGSGCGGDVKKYAKRILGKVCFIEPNEKNFAELSKRIADWEGKGSYSSKCIKIQNIDPNLKFGVANAFFCINMMPTDELIEMACALQAMDVQVVNIIFFDFTGINNDIVTNTFVINEITDASYQIHINDSIVRYQVEYRYTRKSLTSIFERFNYSVDSENVLDKDFFGTPDEVMLSKFYRYIKFKLI